MTTATPVQAAFMHCAGLSLKQFHKLLLQALPDSSTCSNPQISATGQFKFVLESGGKYLPEFRSILTVAPGKHINIGRTDALEPGKGYARQMLAGLEALLEPLNLTELNLTATHTGARLWAMAGFTPTADDWNNRLKSKLKQRMKKLQPQLNPDEVRQCHEALASQNPKAFWLLANLARPVAGAPIGYQLCHDNVVGENLCWSGVLPRRDAECRERLSAYIKREAPPAFTL